MLDVRIADRIEPLLDLLVDQLIVPGADPFAREWVAVPSIGMRRWLSQRLSERLGGSALGSDGISANIDLPFPAELRRSVLAADAVTREAELVDDLWVLERLTWAVLDVLTGAEAAVHPDLAPLTHPPDGGSLVGRAVAVADLLDRYSLHRPSMVRAWAAGVDVDAAGTPIAPAQRWQPALFRAVARHIGVPAPAVRMDDVLGKVASGEVDLSLPWRLHMFGLSTLPPEVLPLLQAVGEVREVRVLLLAPSADAAQAVGASVAPPAGPHGAAGPVRRPPGPRSDVHHPLLRSWGTASLESAATVAAFGIRAERAGVSAGAPTLFDAARTRSLLHQVQEDIRSDRAPDGSHHLEAADVSVQVHACTGITRQVEVLRDALLHLLAADQDLTEGDIAVLCPQIELFSPIIEAVLGPSADADDGIGTGQAPLLRYRITDRRPRADVPLLGVVAAAVDLLPGRFTASAVADFLALLPVRERFGLAPEDLARLDDWIDQANVRWGIDGAHRSSWDLPADFTANSWSAGVDQLLMGTAVRADDLTLAVGEVAPLAVGEGSTVAAARVAEAVRTLADLRQRLVGARLPPQDWAVEIARAVDQLCSLPPAESWQRRRLDRILADLLDQSRRTDGTPSEIALDLSDVRRLLADRLGGEPSRAAFGTGSITFCSLSPLRSVPHRVVCLLGLDQDAIPHGLAAGDDLLAAAPAVGDRDPRAEARQMLLEALLAAGDTVLITCGASDVRTNLAVPPAVVLDELWDCLAATCGMTHEDLRDRLLVTHPRQGFAVGNFGPSGLGGPTPTGPWSFDPLALTGAIALRGRRSAPGADVLVSEPLPPVATASGPDIAALALDRVRQFAVDPVHEFFAGRLGIRFPRAQDGMSDHLPARLDALEKHWLGVALLEARSRGLETDDWKRLARRRGALPPGSLADAAIEQIEMAVDRILASAASFALDPAPSGRHEVDIEVGGRRVVGVVGSCGDGPRPGPVVLHYSARRPKQRITATVDLLALTVTDPHTPWHAFVISRSRSTSKKVLVADTLVLRARGDTPAERRDLASGALVDLLALRELGLRIPLPLFEKTSHGFAREKQGVARKEWSGSPMVPGEQADAPVRAAFGDVLFDDLEDLQVLGKTPAEHARALWDILDQAVREDDADPDAAPGPGTDPS